MVYTSAALCGIWLFLSLTPVLWAPNNWLLWLSMVTFTENPAGMAALPNEVFDVDPPGRCMSHADKLNAIAGPVDDVSGWYGPGAYLSWLLTAYVAAGSSIWHSKCAQSEETRKKESKKINEAEDLFSLPKWGASVEDEADILDGEMIAALIYPLIALCDVLLRLVRCSIDPGMSAAVFVLYAALTIFGPTARLSWQQDGVEYYDAHGVLLPKTNRSWAWKFAAFLIHGVVITLLGEPYAYTAELPIPVYVMLFLLMLYSMVSGERLMEEYPYRMTICRPRAERLVVFGMLQVIFYSVAYGKTGSALPATGSGLWELDQIGTLCVTVFTLLYLRSGGIRSFISKARHRLAGFAQLGGPGTDGGIELQEVIVHRGE
jgi:hypothetical protein